MSHTDSGESESVRRDGAPTPQAIRAQLRNILSSSVFAQSPRQQRFLTFIVQETLAGRATTLKEYSLGLEVFDRDESFDPQTSSIVRVEASRLRTKLQQYYAAAGHDASVRIEIPTGTYVPRFLVARPVAIATGVDAANVDRGRSIRSVWPKWLVILLLSIATLTTVLVFLIISDRPTITPPTITGRDAKHSVAVLPLRNLSNDSDQEHLSDGMTDALITSLARRDNLHVISLTSVMAYKNVNRPISEIARELEVDHIVEGSLLRSGDRVRITAQLIDAATNRHLWAESYERELTDVLAMQEEVSRRIAAWLSGKVEATSEPRAAISKTVDPVAHEAYVKGLYFRNQMTEEGFKKGLAYFEQAIERDPEYAEAYSGIATCYCLLGGHGFEIVDPMDGMPTAKQAVLEAMKLDDALAEPHAFLGVIRLKYEWNWADAEASFKRAIELNPSYAQARIFYSFYLEAMGRQEEAIREAEAARAIDPLSRQVNTNLGWQYLRAGRTEEARRHFEATAELAPRFWGAHWGMGHYYRRKGEFAEAVAAFQRAIDMGGGHTLPIADLGYTYAVSSKHAEARGILEKLKARAERSYVSPYNMATIHVGLGEIDQAFTWLEEAFRRRARALAWLNVAEEYDSLRADPRFKALLRRIGLP